MRAKEAPYLDNIGVRHARQNPRFLQEGVLAFGEILLEIGVLGSHRLG